MRTEDSNYSIVMDESIDSILSHTQEGMQKSLEHLEAQLVKIRAGKASPVMLEGVMVDYYGNPTPVSQVANVSAADAQTLVVKPWERTMIPAIEKAIMEANLGFNPMSDSEMVRVPIPRLNEERRKTLVRQAKDEGENGKIAMRNIRQDANNKLRKLLKDGDGISEDEVKNAEKEVQQIMDEFTKKVDNILKTKENEIMKV